MTLTFKKGDMFSEPVEALVNTVNCVGVMGKGVALEFKRRWPDNFKAYKSACESGALQPGKILTFDNYELFAHDGPRYLVNFPTKQHWRSKSKLAYVEQGLDALVDEINRFQFRSIGIPPLGCGNGGLDWEDVKPLIVAKLEPLNDIEIVIFSPKEAVDPPEFSDSARLSMTFPRAMLLKAMSELEVHFDGAFDRISLQKIVYFLQAFGVQFGLQFSKQLYGPYSEALKRSFISFEKHEMISGFSAGERRAHATPAGCALADEYLQKTEQPHDAIIERLSKLIQGYESPYGLELLASVHWLGDQEDCYPVEKIIEQLQNWNDEKRNRFDDETIRIAYARLEEDGLLN